MVTSFLCIFPVPCSAGHFSRTGLVPCYPCPRDYYQPDGGRSYCLSCPFYGTTTITGARAIQQCSSMVLPFHLSDFLFVFSYYPYYFHMLGNHLPPSSASPGSLLNAYYSFRHKPLDLPEVDVLTFKAL